MSVESKPGYEWASTRWLRRQVSDRRLAFHKIGGRVPIDLGDLDAIAEGSRIEPVRAPSSVLRSLATRRPSA
jgi:hypothetical protein